MLRIGDFARLARVSIPNLRHYDDLGLFKPVRIDPASGYRYYTFDQLPRLNRILAYKDLGFALEQIGEMLGEDIPAGELRSLLRLKQTELQGDIAERSARLQRLEARLRMIEEEGSDPSYAVMVKSSEEILVASVRGTLRAPEEQSRLWQELFGFLACRKIGFGPPFITIYHADEPEVDAEVCIPIPEPLEPKERIQIRRLSAHDRVAYTVHHGPFRDIEPAYRAVFAWIDANGRTTAGPVRQVTLSIQPESSKLDSEAVAEILVPLANP
ncbi:MAG: MerR family transcriptional regulator [Anaerolineales bacterium]|nr:MerR family transcriptional regulator [Anaerolineales bacterium]